MLYAEQRHFGVEVGLPLFRAGGSKRDEARETDEGGL